MNAATLLEWLFADTEDLIDFFEIPDWAMGFEVPERAKETVCD
jgi:hypothetical protein